MINAIYLTAAPSASLTPAATPPQTTTSSHFFPFTPASPHDQFLDLLYQSGLINAQAWLLSSPAIPALCHSAQKKLLEFLFTKHLFSNKTNTKGVEFTIPKLVQTVLPHSKALFLVGGGARHFFEEEDYQNIYNSLKPGLYDLRPPKKEKPSEPNDYDFRTEPIPYHLAKVKHSIIQFITSLLFSPHVHNSTAKINALYYEVEHSMFDDLMMVNDAQNQMLLTKFSYISKVVDILWVARLDRENLFERDRLSIPLSIHFKNQAIYPQGNLQPFIDEDAKIIHAIDPEKINHKGWFILISLYTSLFRSYTANLEATLIIKSLDYSLEWIVKTTRKFQLSHLNKNPQTKILFAFNLCSSLIRHKADELADGLWEALQTDFPPHSGFLKLLSHPAAPLKVRIAILQLCALFRFNQTLDGCSLFLTQHEFKPALQIVIDDYGILFPLDIKEACAVVNQFDNQEFTQECARFFFPENAPLTPFPFQAALDLPDNPLTYALALHYSISQNDYSTLDLMVKLFPRFASEMWLAPLARAYFSRYNPNPAEQYFASKDWMLSLFLTGNDTLAALAFKMERSAEATVPLAEAIASVQPVMSMRLLHRVWHTLSLPTTRTLFCTMMRWAEALPLPKRLQVQNLLTHCLTQTSGGSAEFKAAAETFTLFTLNNLGFQSALIPLFNLLTEETQIALLRKGIEEPALFDLYHSVNCSHLSFDHQKLLLQKLPADSPIRLKIYLLQGKWNEARPLIKTSHDLALFLSCAPQRDAIKLLAEIETLNSADLLHQILRYKKNDQLLDRALAIVKKMDEVRDPLLLESLIASARKFKNCNFESVAFKCLNDPRLEEFITLFNVPISLSFSRAYLKRELKIDPEVLKKCTFDDECQGDFKAAIEQMLQAGLYQEVLYWIENPPYKELPLSAWIAKCWNHLPPEKLAPLLLLYPNEELACAAQAMKEIPLQLRFNLITAHNLKGCWKTLIESVSSSQDHKLKIAIWQEVVKAHAVDCYPSGVKMLKNCNAKELFHLIDAIPLLDPFFLSTLFEALVEIKTKNPHELKKLLTFRDQYALVLRNLPEQDPLLIKQLMSSRSLPLQIEACKRFHQGDALQLLEALALHGDQSDALAQAIYPVYSNGRFPPLPLLNCLSTFPQEYIAEDVLDLMLECLQNKMVSRPKLFYRYLSQLKYPNLVTKAWKCILHANILQELSQPQIEEIKYHLIKVMLKNGSNTFQITLALIPFFSYLSLPQQKEENERELVSLAFEAMLRLPNPTFHLGNFFSRLSTRDDIKTLNSHLYYCQYLHNETKTQLKLTEKSSDRLYHYVILLLKKIVALPAAKLDANTELQIIFMQHMHLLCKFYKKNQAELIDIFYQYALIPFPSGVDLTMQSVEKRGEIIGLIDLKNCNNPKFLVLSYLYSLTGKLAVYPDTLPVTLQTIFSHLIRHPSSPSFLLLCNFMKERLMLSVIGGFEPFKEAFLKSLPKIGQEGHFSFGDDIMVDMAVEMILYIDQEAKSHQYPFPSLPESLCIPLIKHLTELYAAATAEQKEYIYQKISYCFDRYMMLNMKHNPEIIEGCRCMIKTSIAHLKICSDFEVLYNFFACGVIFYPFLDTAELAQTKKEMIQHLGDQFVEIFKLKDRPEWKENFEEIQQLLDRSVLLKKDIIDYYEK